MDDKENQNPEDKSEYANFDYELDSENQKKQINQIININDNLTDDNENDSFNRNINFLYEIHKDKLSTEENHPKRPVSKIKNRISSSSSQKEVQKISFSDVLYKINSHVSKEKLTKEEFFSGESEGSFLTMNDLRNLFLRNGVYLGNNELFEVFLYENPYINEGYISIDLIIKLINFKNNEKTNEDVEKIDEIDEKGRSNKESIKLSKINENRSIQRQIANTSEKSEFKIFNEDIKKILIEESKQKLDILHCHVKKKPEKKKENLAFQLKQNVVEKRDESDKEIQIHESFIRPFTSKSSIHKEKDSMKSTFKSSILKNIQVKILKDEDVNDNIKKSIYKSMEQFENDCKSQIPKLNNCCQVLKLNQRYEYIPVRNQILVSKGDSPICFMDFKKFNIECRRIYKIFFHIMENKQSNHGSIKNMNMNKENIGKFENLEGQVHGKGQGQVKIEYKKEPERSERREVIGEILKSSLKLKMKLQKQISMLSSKVNITDEDILISLNKFINKK